MDKASLALGVLGFGLSEYDRHQRKKREKELQQTITDLTARQAVLEQRLREKQQQDTL